MTLKLYRIHIDEFYVTIHFYVKNIQKPMISKHEIKIHCPGNFELLHEDSSWDLSRSLWNIKPLTSKLNYGHKSTLSLKFRSLYVVVIDKSSFESILSLCISMQDTTVTASLKADVYNNMSHMIKQHYIWETTDTYPCVRNAKCCCSSLRSNVSTMYDTLCWSKK
jgi:hypothetical protein